MHDTVYNGKRQSMVFPDGTPKGMARVLQERGVDIRGMKAADMKQTLASHADFNQI